MPLLVSATTSNTLNLSYVSKILHLCFQDIYIIKYRNEYFSTQLANQIINNLSNLVINDVKAMCILSVFYGQIVAEYEILGQASGNGKTKRNVTPKNGRTLLCYCLSCAC